MSRSRMAEDCRPKPIYTPLEGGSGRDVNGHARACASSVPEPPSVHWMHHKQRWWHLCSVQFVAVRLSFFQKQRQKIIGKQLLGAGLNLLALARTQSLDCVIHVLGHVPASHNEHPSSARSGSSMACRDNALLAVYSILNPTQERSNPLHTSLAGEKT